MAFIDLFTYYLADIWLKGHWSKPIVVFGICSFLFFVDLIFLTDAGFYLVGLCDANATLSGVFLQLTINCIFCDKLFGLESLKKQIFMNTSELVPNFFWISIKYICPLVMSGLLGMNILSKLIDPEYSSLYDCWWAYAIEWSMILGPFVIVAYFYFYYKNENQGVYAEESIRWLEESELGDYN